MNPVNSQSFPTITGNAPRITAITLTTLPTMDLSTSYFHRICVDIFHSKLKSEIKILELFVSDS